MDSNDTSDIGPSDPPTHRLSDYVEIGILAFMIVIGGPLNLVALFRTWSVLLAGRRRSSINSTHRVTSRLTVFKVHLTTANLMVLAMYATSQISWLITYEWLGGDVICRIIKFFHTFCFYATSNLVAAIAVDRLWVMFYVNRPNSFHGNRSTRRLQVCAWTAWAMAFLCSVPQFFLWRTVEAWPNWFQCVSLFMVMNLDDTVRTERAFLYERVYDGLHLALVFWAPAVIIIACYAIIVARFHIYETRGRNDTISIRINHLLPTNNNKSTHSICSAAEEPSEHLEPRPAASSARRALLTVVTATPSISQNSHLHLQDPSAAHATSAALVCRPLLENFSVTTLRRAKRRTLKKTAWLLLCYIVCWSPYNIVALWRHFFNPDFENVFLDILYNLIVLNAVVNPLIYGV